MPNDDTAIGPDLVLAVVIGCAIVGLVLVAGLVPATDTVDEDWSVTSSPDDDTGETPAAEPNGEGSDESAVTLDVSGTTPGTNASATVETEDGPGSDVPILVQGAQVGTTDSAGTVEFSVPYEDEITVTAQGEDWERTETEPISTDIETRVRVIDGRAETITVDTRIDGEPVPDATLKRDGETVGTTDENGTATVALPDGPETMRLERGAPHGTFRLDGSAVSLDIDGQYGLPVLPGGPVETTVTLDGHEVGGQEVRANGEPIATTSAGGTAQFAAPVTNDLTVSTGVSEHTADTTVSGLYARVAYPLLLAGGLGIGVMVTYRRLFTATQRRHHRTTVRRVPDRALWWRDVDPEDPDDSGGGERRGQRVPIGRLRGFVAGIGGSLGWAAQFLTTLRFPTLSLSVPSLPSLSAAFGGRTRRTDDEASTDSGDDLTADGTNSTSETCDSDPADSSEPTVPPIRRAWNEFVGTAGPSRPETATPGQVARHAIAEGYPQPAVRDLTGVFRAVEYGDREPSDSRETVAIESIDRIRSEGEP